MEKDFSVALTTSLPPPHALLPGAWLVFTVPDPLGQLDLCPGEVMTLVAPFLSCDCGSMTACSGLEVQQLQCSCFGGFNVTVHMLIHAGIHLELNQIISSSRSVSSAQTGSSGRGLSHPLLPLVLLAGDVRI